MCCPKLIYAFFDGNCPANNIALDLFTAEQTINFYKNVHIRDRRET